MHFEAIFESLLFLAGEDGVTIEKLENSYNLNRDEIRSYLSNLKNDYIENESRGLEIIEVDQTFIMKTKSSLAPYLDIFLEKYMGKGLSISELNTLAIVAFQQPIMRIQIDEVRGVNSSQILHNLESKKMIHSKKSNAPGRPKVYRTTTYFLKYFNLRDLRDLPKLEEKFKDDDKKELF